MKKLIIILGFSLMSIFYFVFPYYIPRDSFFSINRKIIFDKDSLLNEIPPVQIYPFRIEGKLAYFDENLKLFSLIETTDRLSTDKSYYARYNDLSSGFIIYGADGQQIVKINDEGLPFLKGGRIFSVYHIGGVIRNFNFSGKLLWSYNIGSYITSLYANRDFTIIGGSSGYVSILDRQGNLVFEYRPAGSETEIIYGSVISGNAGYFAIISGLNPQRFLLFKKGNSSYIPIYQQEFKNQPFRPKPMRIKFSKNNDFVVYEEAGFLNGYDISKQRAFQLPIIGKLKDFDIDVLGKYMSFVLENEGKYELNVLNYRYLFPLVKIIIYTKAVVIKWLPQSLVFGVDNEMLSLSYHEK